MSGNIFNRAFLLLALSTPLIACSSLQGGPPQAVSLSHCKHGFHTEAVLNRPNPRHAYWCRSDEDGFAHEPSDDVPGGASKS